jgi:hypothetical protein
MELAHASRFIKWVAPRLLAALRMVFMMVSIQSPVHLFRVITRTILIMESAPSIAQHKAKLSVGQMVILPLV